MAVRRTNDGQQRIPPWMQLALGAVLVAVAVQSCAASWALASTSDGDCPGVVDTNPGRGLDYECSPSGGESKGYAVLLLAAVGLGSGASGLYNLTNLVRRRSRPSDPEAPTDASAPADADTDAAGPVDAPPEPALPRPRPRPRPDPREPLLVGAVVTTLVILAYLIARII